MKRRRKVSQGEFGKCLMHGRYRRPYVFESCFFTFQDVATLCFYVYLSVYLNVLWGFFPSSQRVTSQLSQFVSYYHGLLSCSFCANTNAAISP